MIRADEALFTKVISNVVGNAIKYTNEDGNIWVGVYKRGEEIIFGLKMKRNLLMRKKFQNYVMHFIVLINPEIKELVEAAWDYILQK